MLTKVLEALRDAEGPLGLAELAARLEIEVPALEGMLEQLVRQGKLRKTKEMTVDPCQLEHASGLQNNLCAFLTHGNTATRYEIVESSS
ncbi:MAG: FeoC-like transcriptional regulator [Chloroflexota bacterium]|nr:FeoC-like transcriptional regulator [Chloroflexota bacterium]